MDSNELKPTVEPLSNSQRGRIDELARQTASPDYGIKESAWRNLESLSNFESAIDPLMRVFQEGGAKVMGGKLTCFLAKTDSVHCKAALFVILDYALKLQDAFYKEYLSGSASFALLKMKDGIVLLRSRIPPPLLRYVLAQAILEGEKAELPAVADTS